MRKVHMLEANKLLKPFHRRLLMLGALCLVIQRCDGLCSSGPIAPSGPGNPSFTLSPAQSSKTLGQTELYIAKAGTNVAMETTTWSISASAIATLGQPSSDIASSQVLATCIAPGTATISANVRAFAGTFADQIATAALTCTAQGATPVVIDTPKVKRGSAAQQLVARDAAGAPITSGLTWSSVNPSVASVTSGGLATVVSPGAAPVTATSTSNTSASAQGLMYVLGDGTCTPNPAPGTRNLVFTVQSDPGNHAAQIAFTSAAQPTLFTFTNFQGALYIIATGPAPFVRLDGGFLAPDNCAFAANGQGTFAGKSNVGVRLEGTWTTGTLNLKFTVGTNGELSGGATVYSIAG
jgi:hypothetical protein